jgi:Spy/CpxP family protein refolding chaperone
MTLVRSLLAAGFLSIGATAMAAAQTTAPAPQARAQHQHAKGEHGKDGKAQRGMMGARAGKALFKGIQLSDAEKASVKSVREKYAPQMKALREQAKPQMQAAREARQRGDTAALKQMWAKSAAQREQTKKLLEAERADYRAALTPENRAKFDANVQQLEQRLAKRADKAKDGWKNRAHRDGSAKPTR